MIEILGFELGYKLLIQVGHKGYRIDVPSLEVDGSMVNGSMGFCSNWAYWSHNPLILTSVPRHPNRASFMGRGRPKNFGMPPRCFF